jgi:hypothetical protein
MGSAQRLDQASKGTQPSLGSQRNDGVESHGAPRRNPADQQCEATAGPFAERREEPFERLRAVSYDFTSQRTQEGI